MVWFVWKKLHQLYLLTLSYQCLTKCFPRSERSVGLILSVWLELFYSVFGIFCLEKNKSLLHALNFLSMPYPNLFQGQTWEWDRFCQFGLDYFILFCYILLRKIFIITTYLKFLINALSKRFPRSDMGVGPIYQFGLDYFALYFVYFVRKKFHPFYLLRISYLNAFQGQIWAWD